MNNTVKENYASKSCENPAALLIVLCEGYLTTPVYAKRSRTIIHIQYALN